MPSTPIRPAATDRDELERLCALLADPVDGAPLTVAGGELVLQLAAQQRSGALRERSGALVLDPFDALLVRTDGACAYPVRAGVADLLPGSALLLSAAAA
jgi:hypothetical protein